MRFLVTGGAGFIGSHLAAELLRTGGEVRVFDNFSTGKRANLEGLSGLEILEGDLRNLEAVKQACEGVDYLFHQGALPSVARSLENPLESTMVNTVGTLHVLMAAHQAGVKRVIYAASSSAYGDTPTLPKREEMRPDPLSPYAASKLAGEEYCKVFAHAYGLETVSLRYFNVFGPRQDPFSFYAAVIPKFILLARKGEPLPIFGDGEQSRDFTYIENVVQANLLAMRAAGAAGQVFNIGCGDRISLNQLVEALSQILQRDLHRDYQAARPGDVRHSLADISRAQNILGYQPAVSLREGLTRTVEFFAPDRG
ncbi:MAG: SDR family oxidoreductase [Candidatus Tectomicrobia bacterium]|uniref:SDR family oxidoreductase n=1 Tax=Tectimicrobiota bacterium TaxID=2528274 RepID=A0A932CQI6_UNCTE|nr:SDR family oxidoreductase [Candidatus Tectomicrobia bacterium]